MRALFDFSTLGKISFEQSLERDSYFYLSRREEALSSLEQGVNLTPDLIKLTVATDDDLIIEKVMELAIKSGIKPSSECFNVMIGALPEQAYGDYYEDYDYDHDAQKTCGIQINDYKNRFNFDQADFVALHEIRSKTLQLLIKAGMPVTQEMVNNAHEYYMKELEWDEEELNEINKYLEKRGTIPVTKMLQQELKRVTEIKNSSQVLAQAYRASDGASFFSKLPEDVLITISAKTASAENDVEDHAEDLELAKNCFTKMKLACVS